MTTHISRRLNTLLCASLVATAFATAQTYRLSSPDLNASSGSPTATLPSNSVSHLETRNTTVWIGTGKGLARTTTGGKTWESFGGVPQFANLGIFSIAVRGDTIWTSTGYSKDVDNSSVQTGSGYTYSLDNGLTWNSASRSARTEACTNTT